jgi:tetratricopeptide (TPR) repeat protein
MRLTWPKALIVAGVVLAVLGGAVLVQRLSSERAYQRLLAAGDDALAAGETYRAVESFSGALAFRPASMVAYLRRGEAYRAQERYDEAIRDWREATRLAPEAPQPLVALGELADARGDFSQAADWYGQAIDRLKDEDPAILYRLALARYRAGSPGAAIGPLERAVVRHASSAPAHYLLGLIYRDTNNTARAIQSIELALAIQPELTPAREELADLYRAEGRVVDEMAQLQLLARDGQSSRKVAIGLAEARQGQLDAALGTLSTATTGDTADSRVLLAIGRVYLARAEKSHDGDSIQRATSALEKALGGTARRSEGLALYGRAVWLAGNDLEAERILREAVATSPVDPEAFGFLADAAERLGHVPAARDALMNLDVLDGDHAAADVRVERARRIGEMSMRINEPRVAVPYLGRVVDAVPDDLTSASMLIEARWRTGDVTGAKALLDSLLAIHSSDPRLLHVAKMMK